MRPQYILILILFLTLLPMSSTSHTAALRRLGSYSSSNSTSGLYWFQVGASAASDNGYGDSFGKPITGASVEIRILDQKLTHADTDNCYWVGIDLPNDAFIQVGYMLNPQYNSGRPSLF